MITIVLPAWAFYLLLSLFALNIVLNHMLYRSGRQLEEAHRKNREVSDMLVREITKFFEKIVARQNRQLPTEAPEQK